MWHRPRPQIPRPCNHCTADLFFSFPSLPPDVSRLTGAMSPATGGRRPYRLTVRVISVICALSVMAIYSLSTSKTRNHAQPAPVSQQNIRAAAPAPGSSPRLTGRRLFQYSNSHFDEYDTSDYLLSNFNGGDSDNDDDNGSGDGDQDNCTAPRSHHAGYNDSCSFVLDQCQDWVLFDYLRFILCDMKHIQVWIRSKSIYLIFRHI